MCTFKEIAFQLIFLHIEMNKAFKTNAFNARNFDVTLKIKIIIVRQEQFKTVDLVHTLQIHL
jgi:hypothetical protein